MKANLMIIGIVLALVAIIFIARLAQIQVIDDEVYYVDKTQKKRCKEAKYGHILDRNGKTLWTKLLVSDASGQQKCSDEYELHKWEDVYFHGHLDGLTAILKGVASRKTQDLRGQKSVKQATVKPRRNAPINEVEKMPLVDGKDVYLSIDLRIQEIVENTVREYVPKFEAAGASVLVMDPRTGQILAITNFNPKSKKYEGTIYSYEPGSIFKPITAIIALESGVNPKKVMDTENRKWQVTKGAKEKYIQDLSECKNCNMQEAMRYSSNIAFGRYVVEEVGYEKFYYGVKNFAVNEEPDFPLSVIHKGFERVSELRTQATQGFGHSLDLTSIDMAKAFSSIANGGILYNPKLILKYGKDSAATERDSVRKVISSTENTRLLKEMLKSVVESGTAKHLKSKYDFFEFAGKTGTAQIIDSSSGKYAVGTYNSSFIGVEKATDPHFVCLVTLYNTSKHGGTAAVPLFQKIMEHIYLHPELSPVAFAREYAPESTLCNDISFIGHTKSAARNKANGMRCNIRFDDDNKTGFVVAQTIKRDSIGEYLELSLREHQRNTGIMPDVVGLKLRDALGMLEHLSVVYEGVGNVYKQLPEPGENVSKRSVVHIKLKENI